ncbi:MAG: hypothetical protein ACREDO_12125 [Methyloceanibacter sp.]
MTKIPIKTRVPLQVWTLSAIVTLFSLVSTLTHGHLTSDDAAPGIAQALSSGGHGLVLRIW